MRLKKHNAVAAFHSQLSAILEKLMVLAVEEIKELVFDFCEDISQEKARNTDPCQKTDQDQDQDQEGRLFDTSDSLYIEPQNGNEICEQMTKTSSREDVKEKHSSEQSYKFTVTNDYVISTQETLSPNYKFEQSATSFENSARDAQEEDCSKENGSKQSSFEPPEDSKDHLIDYSSPDETQSTPYEDFSTRQGHSRDVEFHIKQEEETPAFETGNYTGLQMQTGHMETGVQPIGQESLLINHAICNTSHRFAPVPLSIPGPRFTSAYIEKRFNQNNSRTLPRPNKVLFKCEYCSKTYPFPSLLKAHYLKHTEGKQLVCGFCGKLFKWEYSLRRHEKMHLYELKH